LQLSEEFQEPPFKKLKSNQMGSTQNQFTLENNNGSTRVLTKSKENVNNTVNGNQPKKLVIKNLKGKALPYLFTLPYFTLLYCTLTNFTLMYFTLMYFTLMYFTLMYFTLMYFTLMYFTLMYFTLMYFTLMYFTLPNFTLMYFTLLHSNSLYHNTVNSLYYI